MNVRVGVVILPELRWAQARERWARAEQLGFAHAWTYDHLAWRSLADGPWFGTVPTLTAAATATTSIRLGTFVASPNYRHPVPFAKDVMSIDDVSGGRLDLGLGAGGTGVDATVLGGDVLAPAERAERLEEFVELLDGLLTSAATDFAGRHYRAVDARMVPGCVQEPRVPFVVAANGPRLVRLAVRRAQGWVTTGPEPTGDIDAWWDGVRRLAARVDDALAEAGREPATLRRYLSLDSSGVSPLGSVAYFEECVGRAERLGFTDVVVHWPRPDGVYAGDERMLEAVAATLPAASAG